MCGIAGYWHLVRGASPFAQRLPQQMENRLQSQGIVTAMTDTLVRRGLDPQGTWIDPAVGIGLGHRRLAILDLSPLGAQPMISHDSRYAIVFNGEIYNFEVLKSELERSGHQFRSHSDTEVMLAAMVEWGVAAAVKRFVGMFAFALWDMQERVLHLGRDRIGEKPLYYGWVGNTLLFGSELKALVAHPQWVGKIDRNALTLFIRYGYIPAPHSIYQGIQKLSPGTIISFATEQAKTAQPVAYWDLQTVVKAGIDNSFVGSDAEAIDRLDTLLRQTIRSQMVADVPLGAFLSGGIDSSTVVALMQAQSTQPIATFSIGFKEQQYNEAEYAASVAQHLGTAHTELYVKAKDALEVISKLPHLYDEPFADSSQIPTFILSELTRQHATVSLSGDAGYELFGGYNRYFKYVDIWQKIDRLPMQLRRLCAGLMRALPPDKWNALIDNIGRILPPLRKFKPGDKIQRIGNILNSKRPLELYAQLVSLCQNPTQIVLNSTETETIIDRPPLWLHLDLDFASQMMYLDSMTYLPDDILVKVDRAAMGISLESRVPFLDPQIIEFAWQLPRSMKFRDRQGKWLLRQVLYKYVPQQLIDRPKMGFGVPIDLWLRNELREWAEALLDEARLKREGFFDPKLFVNSGRSIFRGNSIGVICYGIF
jgi:asparagine synthase (glutamine-hydrolysing)